MQRTNVHISDDNTRCPNVMLLLVVYRFRQPARIQSPNLG